LGAQVAHTPNVSDADAEKVFRQYAKDGFDFIIGHGGQYVAAAEIVAEEFPRAKFAVVAGGYAGNNKNLGSLGFRREVDYLCGVVAGLKTETNKVAYIGGEAQPHMVTSSEIFENGVKAVNPEAEVSIAWVESWSDKDRTRELAEKEVAVGTDVILANINQASQIVFEVAKNAKISAIGWTKDQHQLAPDTIVTSAIIRMPNLLLEGAVLVQQGRWEGKQYNLGLRDGVLDLAPFHGLLTAEQEEKVNAVKADLLNGQIDIMD
jgi:basic membrane protein A